MDKLLSHLCLQSSVAAEIFQPAESDADACLYIQAVHDGLNESLSVPFDREDVNRLLAFFRKKPNCPEEIALIVWNDAFIDILGGLTEQI